MKLSNTLRHCAALICAASLVLPPIEAHTRKGDKFVKLAQKAEANRNYDLALSYYEQALATDPKDPGYLIASQRAHTQAGERHMVQGKLLLQQQKLDDAMVEFQKAFLADPSSQTAVQLIRETAAMQKERAQSAPGANILTPAERARQELEARINSLEAPPQLRPINDQIRMLKMNNQPARVLYESVGKLAGVNVLFDPQGIETVAGKNFNLDLNNATLEEALDYIALETHSFWKPISRNAIFVTQETDPKRAEYQDEVVKVFYVQNSSTQAEFTEIFNAVRTGAKLNTGIFQVASQNAIVARGTPDTISIVEKLVHDLDKPKPEVVVDVLVMEVNKTLTRTLGASALGQGGLSEPINFTPRSSIALPTSSSGTSGTSGTTGTTSTTTSSTAIPIASLGHLSSADFSTTLPSALLQALLSDSSSRILQRPQIRATDNGKASLKIGEKIPYVSGSLNSAVATPGSIPYATTQFQQIDIGVNIDLQPHVNGPNDVSLHIKVEVSSNPTSVSIGGINEPVIAQRVNEADVRMKDGEVSLLGGLSDVESSDTTSGVPGIVNIPALGLLFGNKTKTKMDDQILVALIPHIVRAPDFSTMGEPGVYAGTDRVVRVQHKPDGGSATLAPTDNTRNSPDGVQNPVPAVVPNSAPPQAQTPATAGPSTNPNTPPAAQTNPTAPAERFPNSRRGPSMILPQGQQPTGDQPVPPPPAQPQPEPPQP